MQTLCDRLTFESHADPLHLLNGRVHEALEKLISLTAGRRLQLAAVAGGTTAIMLIQEGRGSKAAEARWKCDPLLSPRDSTRHRWIHI